MVRYLPILILALWCTTARAVPPIKSSGPIDRAGVTAGWWASSLSQWSDPSFVADGPTATIVFEAFFNQPGGSPAGCYDIRIDNVCVATQASVLANTQSIQDLVHFPYTQLGPIPVFMWENANPADVVFLEQFPSDPGAFDPFDYAWFNGSDSAQNSILSPEPLPPPGGGLRLGNCVNPPTTVATSAVRVEGLTPGETYALTFWWRSHEGQDVLTVNIYGHETFSDATVASLAYNTGNQPGVVWTDLERDGFPGIYLTDSNHPDGNRLLHNSGGTFFDLTGAPTDDPADGAGAAAADVDGDGEAEIYLANNGDPNRLFRGGLDVSFADASSPPIDDPGQSQAVSFVDYDNNGLLDLYLGQVIDPNRLFRNAGGLGFVEVPMAADDTSWSLVTSWGDLDDDGDMDLFLGGLNDAKLLLNDRGMFVDVTAQHAIPATTLVYSADWGDADNDGDLDLYLGVGFKPNVFLRNDNGTLVDATVSPLDDPNTTVAAHWVDTDNDGYLDLHLASNGQSRLLRNDGSGAFFDATTFSLEQTGRISWGAAWADYDCDGWLDVYISHNNAANRLLRNEGGTNHWLQVDLQGVDATPNGIGARITVVTGAGTAAEMSQIREVTAGGVCFSMNSLTAEFGLGAALLVDRVEVRWPGGSEQTVHNVDVDQKILIVEGVTGVDGLPSLAPVLLHPATPNPFNPQTTLRFTLPVASPVDLIVHDSRGRRVRSLLQGAPRPSGTHQVVWDGRDEFGSPVASGAYLYTLQVDGFRTTRRMVLLK